MDFWCLDSDMGLIFLVPDEVTTVSDAAWGGGKAWRGVLLWIVRIRVEVLAQKFLHRRGVREVLVNLGDNVLRHFGFVIISLHTFFQYLGFQFVLNVLDGADPLILLMHSKKGPARYLQREIQIKLVGQTDSIRFFGSLQVFEIFLCLT